MDLAANSPSVITLNTDILYNSYFFAPTDFEAWKWASYSDSFRKTTEEFSGRGTSRHPKVL